MAGRRSRTEITHNILLKVILVFELVSDDRLGSTGATRIFQMMTGGHLGKLLSEIHNQRTGAQIQRPFSYLVHIGDYIYFEETLPQKTVIQNQEYMYNFICKVKIMQINDCICRSRWRL